jgi:hypothetical protein
MKLFLMNSAGIFKLRHIYATIIIEGKTLNNVTLNFTLETRTEKLFNLTKHSNIVFVFANHGEIV